MVALHPYPRGFVIFSGTNIDGIPGNWDTINLGKKSWKFAYDPMLVPEIRKIPNQNEWILIHGLCLNANPEKANQSALDILTAALDQSYDLFLDELDYLGGRHIILRITEDDIEVFGDASSMRTIYFSEKSNIISSHAHLINDIEQHEERTETQGLLDAINSWDRTQFLGISNLLPNHCLNANSMQPRRFYPRRRNRFADFTLTEKLRTFKNIWSRQMESLSSSGAKLVTSITGGADSRTSLALSKDYVGNMEFFTYTISSSSNTQWIDSLKLDKTIVETLKELIPLKHRYLYFGKKGLPNTDIINQRLQKNTTQHHGHWLIPQYANAFPEESLVHLRGSLYEVGNAYWSRSHKENSLIELRKLYKRRTERNRGLEPENSREEDFLNGAKKWEYRVPLHDFHLADLMHWEVRHGKWLAEILNESDIAFQTCVPINVRALIEMTLTFSIEERVNGFFYSELINDNYPVLNFPGKNDVRNLYESTRDRDSDIALARTAQDSAYLQSDMTVVRLDGSTETLECDPQEFYIPATEFIKGTSVRKHITAPQRKGTLTFCVSTEYFRPQGKNHWEYQLIVDGRILLTWDGALQGRDVHVVIDNVRPETNIQIAGVALQTQAGKPSWENASSTLLRNFAVLPRDIDGPPLASADATGVNRPSEIQS